MVEWPERAGGLLAPPDLSVRLELAGAGRRAWLSAPTPAGAAWLALARERFSSSP